MRLDAQLSGSVTTADDSAAVMRQNHKQLLKLVARSFYKELINYGISEGEVLSVAGHLLDNVNRKNGPLSDEEGFYNRLFTIKDLKNDWATTRRLTLHEVSISPLDPSLIPKVALWLLAPALRDSFSPRFPDSAEELTLYFRTPTREYFSILYQENLVGIIGAEQIDTQSAKLAMRKLVGDPRMRGKGIGKRATFLFLYHVFVMRKFRKVYLYSTETNIRNINLNRKSGFELEGVFLEDAIVDDKWRDVIRMALTAPAWLKLFS